MIDFVHNPYLGAEMTPYERFKLFDWVKTNKPKVVIEVGTGFGGSTSYILEASKTGGFGCHVITCDPRRKPSKRFFIDYPFVEYYHCRSDIMIQSVIERGIHIDFIFFDGPEDPEVALNDIKVLEEWITSGTLFCMHDWETEKRYLDGGISTKAKLIRPYMEESKHWEEIEVLNGLVPDEECKRPTVGMCLYKFIR